MAAVAKPNGSTAKPQCTVSRMQNGILYTCTKHQGHENEVGNEEHVARAAEYLTKAPDWRNIAEGSRSLLEWVADHPEVAGRERSEVARRLLVRIYLASSSRPGVVKT